VIEFVVGYNADPQSLMRLIQKHTTSYKFMGPMSISFSLAPKTAKLGFVDRLLVDLYEGSSMD
jgi:hypothetical protein